MACLDRWHALAVQAVARAVQENKDLGLVPANRTTEWINGVLCHVEDGRITPVLPGAARAEKTDATDDDEPLVFRF